TSEIARASARRSPARSRCTSDRSSDIGGESSQGITITPMVESVLSESVPPAPADVPLDALRRVPEPLHGGLPALLRFTRANHMLNLRYTRLLARYLVLKARLRGRLQTDGLCFVCPKVKLELGPHAVLRMGRWSWIGHGTKVRVHEGEVSIGAKTVLGQDCTISAYQT